MCDEMLETHSPEGFCHCCNANPCEELPKHPDTPSSGQWISKAYASIAEIPSGTQISAGGIIDRCEPLVGCPPPTAVWGQPIAEAEMASILIYTGKDATPIDWLEVNPIYQVAN